MISGFFLTIVFGMFIQAQDQVEVELKLPLHEIILNSNYTISDQLDAMNSIFNNGNFNINARDRDGKTALNLATYLKKDIKIIQCLRDHGAKVNEPDLFNVTPLHNSIKFEEIPVAQVLLAVGADENHKNDNGQTPFDLARTDNAKDLLRLQN